MTDTWHATIIGADADFDGAPLLRTQFSLDPGHGAVANAELRATSLGIYEALINGTPVGDDVLSPGWSSYEWRIRYRTYDVTDLLGAENVLGMALGNGWYRGRLGWRGLDALYGDELGAFAELTIMFDDGHRQVVATDRSWRAGPSATTVNQIYDGQSYRRRDARCPAGRLPASTTAAGSVSTLWTSISIAWSRRSRTRSSGTSR